MVLEHRALRPKYDIPEELLPHIPGYLGRRDQEIFEMREAEGRGDWEAIRRIGHKLKGNGAGFGFPLLTDLGEQLMQACDTGRPESVHAVIDAISNEVSEIKFQVSPLV